MRSSSCSEKKERTRAVSYTHLDVYKRQVVRHAVNNKIKVLKAENIKTSYNKETKTFNGIKKKLIDNNSIVTKADKGQTLVILTNEDYKRKINEFFINNNIVEIKSDPTDRFNSNMKSVLNKTKYIITNDEKKYLKMIDPKAPRLRGLPKIHKDDMPVRPLVDFTSAPSYKIAKKIDKILRQYIVFNKSYSLKNSLELVDLTKKLIIEPRHTLASFDLVNLYTNCLLYTSRCV